MKKVTAFIIIISAFWTIQFVYCEEPLKVTIKSDKAVYYLQDPVLITLEIANPSSGELTISYDYNGLFATGWKVNGEEAELPIPAGVETKIKKLKAGETWTETVNLNYSRINQLVLRKNMAISVKKGVFNEVGSFRLSYDNFTRVPHQKKDTPKSFRLVSNDIVIKIEASLIKKTEAIKLAEKAVKDRKLDLNKYYVKSVGEMGKNDRNNWFVTFDLKTKRDGTIKALGGEIYVYVDQQSGETVVTFGE